MTKTFERAHHWTHDKARICAELAERRGPLTICLKTKDEPYFLESWITHHANIVGLRNLVIFDNMSTNEAVWNIYDRFRRDLLLVQFEGYCDALHVVAHYRELYEALKQSTAFFAFLDTDELLVRVENDAFHADASIVEFIQSCGDVNWLPATWLHNAFQSDSLYQSGSDLSVLIGSLRWGKPIVRSQAIVDGVLLHNVQLYSAIAASRTRTNLFLLHRKNLSPERRIAAVIRKLSLQCKQPHQADAVRNFVSEGDELHTILSKEIDPLPQATKHVVFELRRLAEFQEKRASAIDRVEAGHVRFCTDGRIEYFSDTEKELFRHFLADADAIIHTAFAPDPAHEGASEQNGVVLKADPDSVASGAGRVKTTITWNAPDKAVVQIFVGPPWQPDEKLVLESAGRGSTEVDWILPNWQYEFRMYGGKNKKELLAVLRIPKN